MAFRLSSSNNTWSSLFGYKNPEDDKSIESTSTTSSNSKKSKKSKMPAGKLKKKAAAVVKPKSKPAPPVVETEVEKPKVAYANAIPVVEPEKEGEKEKPLKVDAAEIVYGKAKEILLWGKSVPVVSFLVGGSEHVAGKALGFVGTDLTEVDGKIETELTKFDAGVLNPAIEAVAKILIGVAGKSEETMKPIIEMLMVPIGKLIKSKADEATPEAHTENPESETMLNDFKWVAYDFNAGHVQFEVTIPTRMDNIDVLAIKTDFKQRLNRFVAHMSKYHWNLKEMFYMYKPRAFGQILPPFDAQAIIAGQHIRTFDRRHYDFASGSCQYLLARDFQDGNFTVFVNYVDSEQSLTVHSNGKTIDISQDYSVKMDGAKVELPVEFYNTTITRMGAKVVLTSTLGVEVTCDNVHGLCTVDMSGHYFAKTGGLFGTYNYEPSDDFTTSTNVNETSVQTFANSWKTRCTGTNTARSFTPVEGTKEYTACAALFKDSSSSLAPCFGIVKPDNAFHKCINDMSNDVRLTATNGPCKAAKFYETECSMAGIDVMEPAQCVACEVGTSTITMGETAQLTSPVMAVDIVFVVEEKMCNYDIDNKLPPLAKLMERSLSRNAYTDMRFGLVGFGGAGVHRPNHVHTMASKMFATRSEFALGTNELKFSVDDTNKDVFSAIDFAAQYPFRAGASKVIVVLPCSDCSSSSLSERSIAARLNSENINVHVLNQFNFELTVTGKNPPTNYIFGIDGSSVYTLRDSKLFRGNPTLYSIVSKPEDSCSKIALSTGGTIFNQKMMTMMKASTIKSFQTVFANRLSASTTPSRCTSCSCEYNSVFGMSRSVCNKC